MKKRDTKYSYDWLATTRQHAISMWKDAQEKEDPEEVRAWEIIIDDLEGEMAELLEERRALKRMQKRLRGTMERRVMVALVIITILVLFSIVCTSCQTAKGLAGDGGWFLTKVSENIVIDKENK